MLTWHQFNSTLFIFTTTKRTRQQKAEHTRVLNGGVCRSQMFKDANNTRKLRTEANWDVLPLWVCACTIRVHKCVTHSFLEAAVLFSKAQIISPCTRAHTHAHTLVIQSRGVFAAGSCFSLSFSGFLLLNPPHSIPLPPPSVFDLFYSLSHSKHSVFRLKQVWFSQKKLMWRK